MTLLSALRKKSRQIVQTGKALVEDPAYYRLTRAGRQLYRQWQRRLPPLTDDWVHPQWRAYQPAFAAMIEGGVPTDFLHHPDLRFMFYRVGFQTPQQYELDYLKARPGLWRLVQTYQESPVGAPLLDCQELNLSANSLGMLYYFGRIWQSHEADALGSIMEFGGGYGSLCRVFLELLPRRPTYVIVDLPEMLALQFVFLRASSRSYAVVPQLEPGQAISEGAVNLVPVQWADQLSIKPNLFASTFALSETPTALQARIAERRFFDAGRLYLVGQDTDADRWETVGWQPMDKVRQAAKAYYATVELGAYHFANAWELIAWDPT